MYTVSVLQVRRMAHGGVSQDKGGALSDALYHDILANMPIPTCDVLLMNKAKDSVLLFKRTNRPVKVQLLVPDARV